MKKILLVLAIVISSFNLAWSQANMLVQAPFNNATTQVRAPNGTATYAYMRACALVLQSELTNLPTSSTITSFGFTLTNTTNMTLPVAGNFTVYLQNTTDVAYLKGTNWATIITGMTPVYASVITIPQSATSTSVMVTLSTPFVYGNGGIYVAYDWFSTGPFSTVPATFLSESLALSPGCASGNSGTAAPATLGTTAFRPCFLFETTNPFTNDVDIVGIESTGLVASTLNAPHTTSAVVKNASNGPLTNITVSMSVAGANVFANNQIIPSLAAGQSTVVSFAPFNPMNPGTQTITVAVAVDQNTVNNVRTFPQLVSCDIWARNPAITTFTGSGVGFNTGAGILATPFVTPLASSLVGLQIAVSTSTANPGNNVYGVLMNSLGTIIATTNTITLSTSTQNSIITFNFATPQSLAGATTYYFGFAQTANTSTGYFPAANHPSQYVPSNLYFATGINGGALSPVMTSLGYFGLHGVFSHSVTISAPSQTVFCGNSATLNAVSATNYSWSTGATTSSITVNTATANSAYTVIATNTLGCVARATTSVIVTPIQLSVTSTPTLVCAGELVTLQASGASSFTWTSTNGTFYGTSIAETPTSTIVYSLNGSEPSGCTSNTTITVFVNPLPIVNVSASNPSICLGSSVTLNASGNAISYTWSTGPTGSSIIENPMVSTVYTVTGANGVGCIKSNTIDVTVNSFTPAITAPTAICSGQTASLSTTGLAPILWSTGAVFNSINVTPTVTSNYMVSSKGANGCTGTNSVTVIVNPTPIVVAATTRSAICRGESTTLDVSGAATYSWNTASTATSIIVSPTTAIVHVYSVTGTNPEGCSSETQISVRVSFCTTINELNIEQQMSVFPNPTSGKLTIKLTQIDQYQDLIIFNALGEVLVKTPIHSHQMELDLSTFANGIYIVKQMQEAKTLNTLKVVKH